MMKDNEIFMKRRRKNTIKTLICTLKTDNRRPSTVTQDIDSPMFENIDTDIFKMDGS